MLTAEAAGPGGVSLTPGLACKAWSTRWEGDGQTQLVGVFRLFQSLSVFFQQKNCFLTAQLWDDDLHGVIFLQVLSRFCWSHLPDRTEHVWS